MTPESRFEGVAGFRKPLNRSHLGHISPRNRMRDDATICLLTVHRAPGPSVAHRLSIDSKISTHFLLNMSGFNKGNMNFDLPPYLNVNFHGYSSGSNPSGSQVGALIPHQMDSQTNSDTRNMPPTQHGASSWVRAPHIRVPPSTAPQRASPLVDCDRSNQR